MCVHCIPIHMFLYDIGRECWEKLHYDPGPNGPHLRSFLANGLGAELCWHSDVESLYWERHGKRNYDSCYTTLANTNYPHVISPIYIMPRWVPVVLHVLCESVYVVKVSFYRTNASNIGRRRLGRVYSLVHSRLRTSSSRQRIPLGCRCWACHVVM